MANGNGSSITKQDLEDCIDQATEILEAAACRRAIGKRSQSHGDALAALSGDTGDDTDDDDAGN